MTKIVAPYGTWKSPITPELVTSQIIGLSEVQIDGEDVYWIEQRPAEKGRSVIVRHDKNGILSDINPEPFNARTRIHEYGGGSYVAVGGVVYFSNFADNNLYAAGPSGAVSQVTACGSSQRWASFVFDLAHNRLIGVGEEHKAHADEPDNHLVGVAQSSDAPARLASGRDFYSTPIISPDGSKVAWLVWDHPYMPWDRTELWIGTIGDDGAIVHAELAVGGGDESICEPMWSPDGQLYFVSDRAGWWNLYRLVDGQSEAVWPFEAEFAEPHWVFGLTHYGFQNANTLVCAYTHSGTWKLARIDLSTGKVDEIPLPTTVISYVKVDQGRCCFVGASPTQMPAVVSLDLESGRFSVLKRSIQDELPLAGLSEAEPIAYPTSGRLTAFANYYPPQNEGFEAPAGDLPPLLVACHGGPTSATYSQLNPMVQYWTSRGFAFVQVNYGGSTGFGRSYRKRLDYRWGIVDVEDCINCALHLSDIGKVDRRRLAIHGGSAGGFTALCALTFHDVFAAGASLYGVSDLEALALDTHKFEKHYLDRLIGPYPESRDLYVERSPIHAAERLSSPVIFFQGLDDKVVPPNQAEAMVDALAARGITVAYVPFEGEGHGFRKSETIKTYLEKHLQFYLKVLGIDNPT